MKGRERAWSDDERQRVAGMLQEGITMGKIGQQLGLSRNAVIGRVSRDGELHVYVARVVIPVVSPLPPIKPQQHATVVHIKAKVRLPVVELPAAPERGHERPLKDLRRNACRWPVEAAQVVGHFLFCGCARRDKDTRYCAYHHSIAHPETRQ